MSLLKKALDIQKAKRSKRIDEQLNQSKIPDFATYQGKSLVDGTEIIQVGSNEPVSGYRLISNAPVFIGDKVSLRSSAIGGLQRVDARNSPIPEPIERIKPLLPIITAVPLIGLDFGLISGVNTFFQYVDNTFSSPTKKISIGYEQALTLAVYKNFEIATSPNLSPSQFNLEKNGSRIALTATKPEITSSTFTFLFQLLADPKEVKKIGSKGVRTKIILNSNVYKIDTEWGGSGGLFQINFLQSIPSPNAEVLISFTLI